MGKKKDDGFAGLAISPSMKEDIERERELEDVGPFSHWLEDSPSDSDDDIGPFSHWLED